jgi:hypothetical protein
MSDETLPPKIDQEKQKLKIGKSNIELQNKNTRIIEYLSR